MLLLYKAYYFTRDAVTGRLEMSRKSYAIYGAQAEYKSIDKKKRIHILFHRCLNPAVKLEKTQAVSHIEQLEHNHG